MRKWELCITETRSVVTSCYHSAHGPPAVSTLSIASSSMMKKQREKSTFTMICIELTVRFNQLYFVLDARSLKLVAGEYVNQV